MEIHGCCNRYVNMRHKYYTLLDRYVIIGSHRDSRDPYYSSRTILEMVLVFARLRKTRGIISSRVNGSI